MAVSNTAMHCPPVVVWTLRSISMVKRMSSSRTHSPKPHDGKDAAGQNDKVAEVIAERHACEYGEWRVKLFEVSASQPPEKKSTYSGTNSTICCNDQAHESVTENTRACQMLAHNPSTSQKCNHKYRKVSEEGYMQVHSPIAMRQLRPTAIMEDAMPPMNQ